MWVSMRSVCRRCCEVDSTNRGAVCDATDVPEFLSSYYTVEAPISRTVTILYKAVKSLVGTGYERRKWREH